MRIRKGDILSFTSSFRMLGNTPISDTVSGYTLYLGCPIDSDVTSFTVTNESTATIMLTDDTRWDIKFNQGNNTDYITGSIVSYEFGIVSLVANYSAHTGHRSKIAVLAFPSTTPTIFTFS